MESEWKHRLTHSSKVSMKKSGMVRIALLCCQQNTGVCFVGGGGGGGEGSESRAKKNDSATRAKGERIGSEASANESQWSANRANHHLTESESRGNRGQNESEARKNRIMTGHDRIASEWSEKDSQMNGSTENEPSANGRTT
jgi:hypothetical protein